MRAKQARNRLRWYYGLATALLSVLVIMLHIVTAHMLQLEKDSQLIAAIKRRDDSQAIILLDCGADPNTRVGMPVPIRNRLIDAMKRIVHRSSTDSEGPSPLMLVFDLDQTMGGANPEPLSLVRALLEKGADVNTASSRSEWYRSPLILHASSAGYYHCVQLLLDHGADVNAKNDAGMKPIMLAGNIETLKTLIRNGADVNTRTSDGLSVLHVARLAPDAKERVRLLMAAGAHE